MEKGMQKLSIQQNSLQIPCRQGIGTIGPKVELRANYVKVKEVPNLKLLQYNFDVITSRDRQANRSVRGKVFVEMVKQNKFGKCIPVYDWNDLIYCSARLPTIGKEVIIPPSEDGYDRPTPFTVKVTYHKEINLQVLRDYITSEKVPQGSDDYVQTCVHALNAYINYKVRTSFLSVGRGIYPPINEERRILLQSGEELRKGFCQSLRIGWKELLVNVDTCSGVFFPPGNVVNVIGGLIRYSESDMKLGLYDEERNFLNKMLKGIKIFVRYRDDKRDNFTIDGLTRESADTTTFNGQDNKSSTVSQYFQETYGKKLEFGKLPCIIVKKKIYLPLEVCEIIPDQPFRGNISENARAEMIKHTCVKPADRFRTIDDSFRNFFRYDQNEHLKSINMNIDINTRVVVEGRRLPPVNLRFIESKGRQVSVPAEVPVPDARWNYVNRKFLDPKTIVNWSVLLLTKDHPRIVDDFMRKFRDVLINKGMNVVDVPKVVPFFRQRKIEEGLALAIKSASIVKDMPRLVIVIMSDRSSLYGEIKRYEEAGMGVITQVILSKHFKKSNEQLFVNIGLKINKKLGGNNCSLSNKQQMSFISSAPTMVFGADVYHSGKNEQSVPSIAAVCASMDQDAIVYGHTYSMNKKPRNETIEDLEEMVSDLIKTFKNRNGCFPQKILFYRDGVSEGQFKKVLEEEVKAMKKAFENVCGNRIPKLTFVIVQKRHNTRFMPTNTREADRLGNCKPGTVVDTGVVAKHEFDFFLQSHASLQGTARSAHYRVLVDENKFNADSIQELTNKLCYLNARCTSAISIVTPAYYAHLIANRARHCLIKDKHDNYFLPELNKNRIISMNYV
ncbi:15995_t:CDS:10 [Funneliformis geosporum]|uniref:7132_t:CDS:1 n=1 Tax=Funneliformis geosporum TaxID=1117311 RepID=A0A9W4WJ23_9GLOM|nr:15995_t:CDS:10 [Funneliformis geosporum]CAI2165382.1 7132_t:CDS:10 [Funneliformis geosporum]